MWPRRNPWHNKTRTKWRIWARDQSLRNGNACNMQTEPAMMAWCHWSRAVHIRLCNVVVIGGYLNVPIRTTIDEDIKFLLEHVSNFTDVDLLRPCWPEYGCWVVSVEQIGFHLPLELSRDKRQLKWKGAVYLTYIHLHTTKYRDIFIKKLCHYLEKSKSVAPTRCNLV